MECPCKDCPDKGCGAFHDECEKYIKWSKAEAEKRERVREGKRKGQTREYIKESTFRSRVNRRR